jgi:hypothetical protein
VNALTLSLLHRNDVTHALKKKKKKSISHKISFFLPLQIHHRGLRKHDSCFYGIIVAADRENSSPFILGGTHMSVRKIDPMGH